MKTLIGFLAATTALTLATPASAAVRIDFVQSGPDVVATATGTFDQTGLTVVSSRGFNGNGKGVVGGALRRRSKVGTTVRFA